MSQTTWYAAGDVSAAAASTPPHSLATASGLLLGTTLLAMLAGALVGWALGEWGVGLLAGAVVGIPLSVGVVYKVYTAPRA